MAKRCHLTGVGPQFGHKVSHANNRSNRKFLPNLQWKRVWVPELQRWVRLRLTVKALKTLDKKGLFAMLKELEESGAHELLREVRRRLALPKATP
jgi:large subunit ribosomal protein L28